MISHLKVALSDYQPDKWHGMCEMTCDESLISNFNQWNIVESGTTFNFKKKLKMEYK